MKNCRIYSNCYLPILESAFVYMVLPLHKYTKVITKNKNKPFGKGARLNIARLNIKGCGNRTKKEQSCELLFFLCHTLTDYRTFIDDYLKILDFIEWLKVAYPEKAAFLTKKS